MRLNDCELTAMEKKVNPKKINKKIIKKKVKRCFYVLL